MQLQLLNVPVLLLVPQEQEPPASLTPLEDWLRYPNVDTAEMQARLQNLRARARHTAELPVIDQGIIRVGETWKALSPLAERLATTLACNFGELVPSDELAHVAWPDSSSSQRNLHVAVGRLRSHIQSLGIDIHTLIAKGYLMDWAPKRA